MKCHWCGAADRGVDKFGFCDWECFSFKHGREPVQSKDCRIRVLERRNAELLEACKAIAECVKPNIDTPEDFYVAVQVPLSILFRVKAAIKAEEGE